MTGAQFLGIIVAIIGSSGLWHFIESRFSRKDKKKDEMEAEASAIESAVLAMLYDRLDPMLKSIILRPTNVVGIDEFKRIDNLYIPYIKLGGNGTITRRYQIVDTYERINDDQIERID